MIRDSLGTSEMCAYAYVNNSKYIIMCVYCMASNCFDKTEWKRYCFLKSFLYI